MILHFRLAALDATASTAPTHREMLNLISQLLARFLLSLESELELLCAVAAIAFPNYLRRLRGELIVGLGRFNTSTNTTWCWSLTLTHSAHLAQEVVIVLIADHSPLHSTTIATATDVAEYVHLDRKNQYQPKKHTVDQYHEYVHLAVHRMPLVSFNRVTAALRVLRAEPGHIFQSGRVEDEGAHAALHGEQLGKPVDEVANALCFWVEADGN